jgi:hypothetical protein
MSVHLLPQQAVPEVTAEPGRRDKHPHSSAMWREWDDNKPKFAHCEFALHDEPTSLRVNADLSVERGSNDKRRNQQCPRAEVEAGPVLLHLRALAIAAGRPAAAQARNGWWYK